MYARDRDRVTHTDIIASHVRQSAGPGVIHILGYAGYAKPRADNV